MSNRIELSGTKTEQVKITVSPQELCKNMVDYLRTKYKLHGNWIQGDKLMAEEGDYHSDWDVVVRDATPQDRRVLGVIDDLEALVKEKVS